MTTLPRESKYRHIFNEVGTADQSYVDISPDCFGDSQHIDVNTKYFAVPITSGGGGSFMIHELSKTGRITRDHPLVKYHKSRLCELSFSNFNDNIIATSSDDCTVRICKFPEEISEDIIKEDALLAGHAKKATAIKWHPTADNVLATAGFDKSAIIWDVENAEEAIRCPDHDDLIFSIAWNANGQYLASSCQDRKIRILDPRDESGAILQTDGHENKKNSKVFWVNSRKLIGSVGFNKMSYREILFYDQRKFDSTYHVHKLDRQNSKFLPIFEDSNDILFLAGKGDCGIRAYELSDQEGFCHGITEIKMTEPQKGVAVYPRRGIDTSKGEILKVYRLKSNGVEPVSICVPRRNSAMVFQEDLYPDCYAGEPSISIDEYFEGVDREPKLMSLDTTKSNTSTTSRFRGRAKQGEKTDKQEVKEQQKKPQESPKLTSNAESRRLRRKNTKPTMNEKAQNAEQEQTSSKTSAVPNVSGADKEKINSLQSENKKLRADLEMAQSQLSEMSKEMKEYKNAAKAAETELEKERTKGEKAEQAIEELKKKLSESATGKDAGASAAEDEALTETIKALTKKAKIRGKKIVKLKSEVEKLEQLIEKQASTIKDLNKKLAEFEH